MYSPARDEVRRLAERGNLIAVYREILADLETPVSAYLKVARGPGSFLLESVEGGERLARYSFIGTEPSDIARFANGQVTFARKHGGASQPVSNPLDIIRDELDGYQPVEAPGLPRFTGGVVGFLAYECVRYFERLPSPTEDTLGLPEAVFLFTDTLLVFDHLQRKIKVVSHAHVNGDPEAAYDAAVAKIDEMVGRLREGQVPRQPRGSDGTAAQTPETASSTARTKNQGGEALGYPIGNNVYSNMEQSRFESMVERAKEFVDIGDIIQVVPSQRFSRVTSAHPFAIYRALRAINPSPYMYYLDLGDFQIVGASPEMLVRVEDSIVTTHPIAGTRRRGATPEEDDALEAELSQDEKECAEHIMLVDLGRNDIGRVSQPGTVRVDELMKIERYSHVMHLVSHVTGRLRNDMSALDALQSCFPAGTVSGAPKIRAMEIIAELEPVKRGPYAGAVGYFSYSGNLDTAIAIRTMVYQDGVATIQAGGGIVADSIPSEEYTESRNKARALLNAIEFAEKEL